MSKAYSYLRFSTPEQMKGDSFRRQSEAAQRYAKQHGLELDDKLTFNDLGVSAFRGKNASVGRLAEFQEAVRSGLVEQGSFLLVENLDRISRQNVLLALHTLEGILISGVNVVTLVDGQTYSYESLSNNPGQLLTSVVTFMRANEESATKSKRVRAAYQNKRVEARQGKVISAHGPFWLRLDRDTRRWSIDPERARVIRWAVKEALSGRAVAGIAKELNRLGERPPKHGAMWHPTTVRQLLTTPALVGTHTPQMVEWEGRRRKVIRLDPIPGYFPALLDQPTFDSLQARLSRTPGRSTTPGDANLLRGLASCASCGAPMHYKGPEPKQHAAFLVCAAAKNALGLCRYRTVPYASLEAAFLATAEHMLAQVPSEDGALDATVEQAQVELEAAEEALGNAQRAYEKTGSDRWLRRSTELEDTVAQLKARVEELEEKRLEASGPLAEHRARTLLALLRAPVVPGATAPLDRKAVSGALQAAFQDVIVDAEAGTAEFRWRHGGSYTVGFPRTRRGRPNAPAKAPSSPAKRRSKAA